MSNPWIKFYPRDWRGDQALRAVSVAARGLWIECLCIMHEAKPYGHLLLNGEPVGNDALARMAGASLDETAALLAELEKAGVFSRSREGVIYSRRMTKDYGRAVKGAKSAKKRWAQGAENAQKSARPNGSPNGNPITQKPEARGQKKEKRASAPSSYPDDFEAFWRDYPDITNNSKRKACESWLALSDDDRAMAKAALPAYAAFLAKPNAPPCAHATTYLNQRRFETLRPIPTGPDIPGEVALFAASTDDRQRRRRWQRVVGGPCPDEDGCRAPPDLLAEHGFGERERMRA